MTIAIAIHGGAGVIRRADLSPETDRSMREGLAAALEAGHAVLRAGGSALDAVTAAVSSLEDNPLFNAGRGAVFTLDGRNELEAAVMDGATRDAGAVTGVTAARNPVQLARRVMETCPHVSLGFGAADDFARREGLPCVEPDYFFTERRWQQLQQERERQAAGGRPQDAPDERKHGTVGAVALDQSGHLAAATSTGGRTAKWSGRIGDTPTLGAGTWADQRCAVSCTGSGEHFMRSAAAHDVSARMGYLGESVDAAAEAVVRDAVGSIGGTGGLIALDTAGRVAMPMNCEGMYRAMVDGAGRRLVAIYGDEH